MYLCAVMRNPPVCCMYASVLGGRRLAPASAINVATTPSH